MSLGACLSDMLAKRAISPGRAEAMQKLYDELVEKYEPRFGRATAEAKATQKAMDAIDIDFAARKRAALLSEQAWSTIQMQAREKYKGGNFVAGLIAHLVDDGKAPFGNVEYRWKSLRNDAHRMMYDILWKHRANVLGQMRNKSDFDDVIHALDGRDAGLNAKEMADSWKRVGEWMRQMFNAAGGHIAKMEGWDLPHLWDGVKVSLAGFEAWRAEVAPRLNRAKMIDYGTGEPLTDVRLDDVLWHVYQAQSSDGNAGREANAGAQGKALYNQRTEHRVLHFNSPEDWLAVNERFGAGHPFEAMLGHIDSMTRDIAAMQILGPNPTATIRRMQDAIGIEAMTGTRLAKRFAAEHGRRTVESIWDEITGMNRVAARPNIALFFSTLRNWQAASKLGGALFSSMPDAALMQLTLRFNGLPQTHSIREIAASFNPADQSHREFLHRALLIQDEMIGRAAGFGRAHFEGELGGSMAAPTIDAWRSGKIDLTDMAYLKARQGLVMSHEVSRRAANFTIRAGLLNQWTLQLRNATVMEFWNGITHFAGTAWNDLNPGWRGFLERYGVGAEDWARVADTPRTEFRGTQWILPDAIQDAGLRAKLVEGVLTELDYAVATGGIRQRARMTVGRPGEIPHEIVRTFGQFLLFPITIANRHVGRAWGASTIGTKVGYAGGFLTATWLMGALAEQLHQLKDGKDPRPMDEWAFWRKALTRGGAMGYYGDMLEHVTAENGRGVKDITNAPVVGGVADLVDVWRAEPGRKRTRAAVKAVRSDTPGINIWWLKSAINRTFLDNLDELADKSPGSTRAKMEKRARKEGTQYWWPHGTGIVPERAPDFANALGGDAEPAAP